MKNKHCLFLIICIFLCGKSKAQDFGFGFSDNETEMSSSGSKTVQVELGGEASASMIGYTSDIKEGPDHVALGDIFSGKLKFSASNAFADGIVNLNLVPDESPVSIDEAYVRAYFGRFDIEAGLRKLSWGKADSLGPLDVINPLDYSKIFIEMADNVSLLNVKIARPLVHAAFRFGEFSKIEGVFVPWFQPHYIPRTGRWADSQMEGMFTLADGFGVEIKEPDTRTLDYAQAGLRFTTTVGRADIGIQYYYGRLREPSADIAIVGFIGPWPKVDVDILYNPYHQIGFDYAQVLFGFNTRAEIAANITEDLKGDDGSIYNPSIAWSLGFDRDLFWSINLNLQVNESIRLLQNKVGEKLDTDNPMSIIGGNIDIEGGKKQTATRLSAAVSRKFLRDELELRTALAWGIEDKDCVIMPSLIWEKNDLRFSFSGGIFAGDADGQIGQYKERDNHFMKISIAYTF